MKVVYVDSFELPTIEEIDGSLSSMQELVDGLIEVCAVIQDYCVVANEEGRLRGFAENMIVNGVQIVGPFFIYKNEENENLVGLEDEDAKRIQDLILKAQEEQWNTQ
jgi:hypothetical protein